MECKRNRFNISYLMALINGGLFFYLQTVNFLHNGQGNSRLYSKFNKKVKINALRVQESRSRKNTKANFS